MERVGEAADLSVVDGGTTVDRDFPIASRENADLKCALRIRLRREIGGSGGIAVAACVPGELCEKRVDVGFGERAAKVRCRPLIEGGSGELRAVLLDIDARETEGCRRTAAACGRQTAFEGVLLYLFGRMHIGLRQIRRRKGCARQEKRSSEGHSKSKARVFFFYLQRKDSFSQRFNEERIRAIKGASPEFRGRVLRQSGRIRASVRGWDAVSQRHRPPVRSPYQSAARHPARARREVRPADLRRGW